MKYRGAHKKYAPAQQRLTTNAASNLGARQGFLQKQRPTPLRIDPTRTTMLRQELIKELRRRFGKLKLNLVNLVVREDALGLKDLPGGPFVKNAHIRNLGATENLGARQGSRQGLIHNNPRNPRTQSTLGARQGSKPGVHVEEDDKQQCPPGYYRDEDGDCVKRVDNAEDCPPGECCPHCGARLERDPYSGKCNSCGKDWPVENEGSAVVSLPRNDPTQPKTKYASTQVELDQAIGDLAQVKESIKTLQNLIDPADVIELEEVPHITVRYGLHDTEAASQLALGILRGTGVVPVRIGGLSLFKKPDADVLKYDVISPQLDVLHRNLGIIPNTNNYPTYRPHLTIAYLKPGAGDKYLHLGGLTGQELAFKKVMFSTKERQKTPINLLLNAYVMNNCGTGAGGFQQGNECAAGSKGQTGGGSLEGANTTVQDTGTHINVKSVFSRDMTLPDGTVIPRAIRNVAIAEASRDKGQITLVKVHVDEEIRGKGIPRALIAKIAEVADKEGVPVRTTGVFSGSGKTMMDKMVRDGLATTIPGGDYQLELDKFIRNELVDNDCGTGQGGFKPGNECAKGGVGGARAGGVAGASPTQTGSSPVTPPPQMAHGAPPSAGSTPPAPGEMPDQEKKTLLDKLKSAGAAIGHFEHVAKQYALDKIESNVMKLPEVAQSVLRGAYFVGKMGTAAAFATWTVGQSLAERVAKERGATPEQARTLRGVLAATDIATMKPIQIGLGSAGLGALALPASLVPPATASYLAYSTATSPLATARAAGGMVKDAYSAVVDKFKPKPTATGPQIKYAKPGLMQLNEGPRMFQYEGMWYVQHARVDESEHRVNDIADALEENNYDDWFVALLMTAMDETGDVNQAIEIATALFLDPQPPIKEQPDDVIAVMGDVVLEAELMEDYHKQETHTTDARQEQVTQTPDPTGNQLTDNARWRFHAQTDKVNEFRKWIKGQINENIRRRTDEQLWHRYIQTAYARGMDRAHGDVSRKRKGQVNSTKQDLLNSTQFRPDIVEKVRLLANRAYTDLEGVTDAMATAMARTLADGLVQDLDPSELAEQLVANVDGIGLNRAMLIARTEIVRAHAEGQLDAMESMGVDEVTSMVEWDASGSACNMCAPMDGAVLTIQEAHGLLPRHPNCVLADTEIICPDSLAVMSAKYTGPVCDLFTATGRRLSVTINHIILTQRGWVFAKDITNSDYLVESPITFNSTAPPDNNNSHPNIGEVFKALIKVVSKHRTTKTLPMGEYFHGDGVRVKSEIDIVSTDGVLRSGLDSSFEAKIVERFLFGGDVLTIDAFSLVGKRRLSEFFKRADSAATRLVRSMGVTSVLLGRSLLHHDSVGFSGSSDAASRFGQHSSNSPSSQAKLLSDRLDTAVCQVELDNVLAGKLVKVERNVLRHVTDLRVYDVSTQSTLYTANGFITSNCRCAWTPASEGDVEEQITRKRDIERAIKASSRAAGDKDSWLGKDKTIQSRRGMRRNEDPGLLIINRAMVDGQSFDALAAIGKLIDNDCGTGAGGFKPGNTCAAGSGGSGMSGTRKASASVALAEPSGGAAGSEYGDPTQKPAGTVSQEVIDASKNRPSLPKERVKNAAPVAQPWEDPPAKLGKKGEGMKERPKGEESQTKVGDLGERLAQELGFRNVLPEGKRNFTAAEVKKQGSSIDTEYDHSGRLYELKLCNTTATEYRLKAKKEEKDAKLKYAKTVKAEAWTMVAVRDAEARQVYFYGAKKPGLIGAEVSDKAYDFLGKVSYE